MTVKICGVVTASNLPALKGMVRSAEKQGAHLLEIRLDHMMGGERNLEEIRETTDLPLIATARSKSEGGLFESSERIRVKILSDAATAGFDYVDVELRALGGVEMKGSLEVGGAKLIISHHDFKTTPNLTTLARICKEEVEAGAEICKIITTATSPRDNLPPLKLLAESSSQKPVVAFCMGRLGVISRVFSPLLGAPFTYASIEEGAGSAPGQMTIQTMRKIYSLLGV